MEARRVFFLLLLLALGGCSFLRPSEPPRIAVAPVVTAAAGINVMAAPNCNWAASMPQSLSRYGKGSLVLADESEAGARHVVSIEITRFDFSETSNGREYVITARANVRRNGKLIASLDLSRENDVAFNKPFCPVLEKDARKIAEEFEDWLHYTYFASCEDDCQDIHPDEPIVMAPVPLRLAPSSVNDETVGECGWEAALVKNTSERYERRGRTMRDPVPLLIQDIDIRNYTGRKLIVVVDDMYVVGGGRYTGKKWMKLSGALIDHGFVVANFEWQVEDTGSYSACKTMLNMSESAGEYIGEWLQRPSVNVPPRAGILNFLKAINPRRIGVP